jgi:glucosamine--fructose-6-phosphate aminotransferase (isomerizing)
MITSSPLLGSESPLGTDARRVVERVHLAELAKAATLPTDDERDEKRRRRVGWTYEELLAQPAAITETLQAEGQAAAAAVQGLMTARTRRAYLVGCGDSLAVMVGMRSLLERLAGIPCEPMEALDFAYYYSDLCGPDTLVIALSSSGETARTVEAVLMAAARGAPTLALTNTADSTLVAVADHHLIVHATRRGWPTQASTAAMALIGQLAVEFGRLAGRSEDAKTVEQEIGQLGQLISDTIASQEPEIAAVARNDASQSLFLYAGGGPAYACAMFGAAKMKECAPAHAIAIPLEEYHHYNSQKRNDPLMLFAPPGATTPRAVETAQSGRRAGGRVYAVVGAGESAFDGEVDKTFRMPEVSEFLSPIVYAIPGQLFAYHVALEKFRQADARQR